MSTEANKTVVRRFNMEFISTGNPQALAELLASDVVDHNAVPGLPPGAEGIKQLFLNVFRVAFPDLRAEIYDQVGRR